MEPHNSHDPVSSRLASAALDDRARPRVQVIEGDRQVEITRPECYTLFRTWVLPRILGARKLLTRHPPTWWRSPGTGGPAQPDCTRRRARSARETNLCLASRHHAIRFA